MVNNSARIETKELETRKPVINRSTKNLCSLRKYPISIKLKIENQAAKTNFGQQADNKYENVMIKPLNTSCINQVIPKSRIMCKA